MFALTAYDNAWQLKSKFFLTVSYSVNIIGFKQFYDMSKAPINMTAFSQIYMAVNACIYRRFTTSTKPIIKKGCFLYALF